MLSADDPRDLTSGKEDDETIPDRFGALDDPAGGRRNGRTVEEKLCGGEGLKEADFDLCRSEA